MAAGVVAEAIDILRRGDAISGLADCHVPGLFSIALRPRRSRTEGMLRIFYAGAGCPLWSMEADGDFVLMPHNHRQDIGLYRLFGEAWNVLMDDQYGAETLHQYAFGSALLDKKFTLDYRKTVRTIRFNREQIVESGLQMRWDEVHTVVAMPHSAWIVREGELAPEPFTALAYSRRPRRQLSAEGLYRPMSARLLGAVRRELLRRAGA
jgi:hypothetical protein